MLARGFNSTTESGGCRGTLTSTADQNTTIVKDMDERIERTRYRR